MQRGRPLYQTYRLHLADAVSCSIQREQPEDDSICSHPSHRVRISDPAPHHPDKQTNEKPPSSFETTQLPSACLPQAPHPPRARHSPPPSLPLPQGEKVAIAANKRPVTPTTGSHGATGSVSVTRESLCLPGLDMGHTQRRPWSSSQLASLPRKIRGCKSRWPQMHEFSTEFKLFFFSKSLFLLPFLLVTCHRSRHSLYTRVVGVFLLRLMLTLLLD